MKVALPASFPRCKICKKPLKNSDSINKGIGPECAEKFAWMLCDAGLTIEALEIPESISTEPSVRRYLRMAESALLAGRKGDVERFKTAAKETAQRLILLAATV